MPLYVWMKLDSQYVGFLYKPTYWSPISGWDCVLWHVEREDELVWRGVVAVIDLFIYFV